MADYNVASESVNKAAPVNPGMGGVPAGLDPSSPDAQQALSDYGRSAGYMGKSVLTGAAMGAQAGQAMNNPLSAFIQGAAAGLQAPAQAYAAKREQIQSALDATPFAITHPEVAGPGKAYAELGGMPTAIGLKILQQAYVDSSKVNAEYQAASKLKEQEFMMKQMEKVAPQKDYKVERDMTLDFNKLPEVGEYKVIKTAYNQAMTAPLKMVDPVTKQYVPNGAGQLAVITAYIKSINPQARFGEGTIGAADVGSTISKNTIDLYNKVVNGSVAGEDEINKMKQAVVGKYKSSLKAYRPIADLWSDSAEKQGLNPHFVLSGDTGSGESIDDILLTIKAQNPGMSDREIFAIAKSQGF